MTFINYPNNSNRYTKPEDLDQSEVTLPYARPQHRSCLAPMAIFTDLCTSHPSPSKSTLHAKVHLDSRGWHSTYFLSYPLVGRFFAQAPLKSQEMLQLELISGPITIMQNNVISRTVQYQEN